MKTPKLLVILCLLLGYPLAADTAQGEARKLTPAEMETLVGPVALYPDVLIGILLPASVNSTDIVLAARFLENGGTVEQVEAQSWDQSVRSLAHYPEVLKWMDENLEWTQQLGDTFLTQPEDVMAAIQRLRARAQALGNMPSTNQLTVVQEEDYIRIIPTVTETIYVPYYDPDVIFVSRYYWGFGPAWVCGSWLLYDCNWISRSIWFGTWRPAHFHRPAWHHRPHRPLPANVVAQHTWRPRPGHTTTHRRPSSMRPGQIARAPQIGYSKAPRTNTPAIGYGQVRTNNPTVGYGQTRTDNRDKQSTSKTNTRRVRSQQQRPAQLNGDNSTTTQTTRSTQRSTRNENRSTRPSSSQQPSQLNNSSSTTTTQTNRSNVRSSRNVERSNRATTSSQQRPTRAGTSSRVSQPSTQPPTASASSSSSSSQRSSRNVERSSSSSRGTSSSSSSSSSSRSSSTSTPKESSSSNSGSSGSSNSSSSSSSSSNQRSSGSSSSSDRNSSSASSSRSESRSSSSYQRSSSPSSSRSSSSSSSRGSGGGGGGGSRGRGSR